MSDKIDKATAARLLGMKVSEIRRVIASPDGPIVQTHCGTETLLRGDLEAPEFVLVNRRVPGVESLLDAEEPDEDDEDELAPAATPAKKAPVRGR